MSAGITGIEVTFSDGTRLSFDADYAEISTPRDVEMLPDDGRSVQRRIVGPEHLNLYATGKATWLAPVLELAPQEPIAPM